MLKIIKELYNKTKLRKISEEKGDEAVPEAWVKVFYKEYPRLNFTALEQSNVKTEFDELLNLRESQRYFSDRSIGFNILSDILYSCRIVDTAREPERRTYPSGGARFPVETYLINYNVEKIPEGAYHYNIKNNGLEMLLENSLKKHRREFISPYLENPAATIIFTSVISRSEIKYGYKAFQYSFIESGHMAQNMLLKCSELGIGACPVSGFVNDTITTILDLTDQELVLYTLSLGWVKKNI